MCFFSTTISMIQAKHIDKHKNKHKLNSNSCNLCIVYWDTIEDEVNEGKNNVFYFPDLYLVWFHIMLFIMCTFREDIKIMNSQGAKGFGLPQKKT